MSAGHDDYTGLAGQGGADGAALIESNLDLNAHVSATTPRN
jgi:hypothetical protein